ncbi:alkaline shock response membrane anchor protein AmaP [Paenibacillus filicis]|uniref:Alkaline shock response membrane anchor protein AmaP n=1 Tax=Paenibacillus gyeongsangnamensis TaxID=3388067 RepID=A0ABT4Q7G8_9BACL|nr:alkaline shock response membrane anchor protein AmaP [Paenibacillus filicis]MCZ8512825.1 alkaline shock response membrane anchor protein AmaP [Paenibacillus filicis]
MVKVLDRLLLLLFSIVVLIVSIVLLFAAFGLIPLDDTGNFVYRVYKDIHTAVSFIVVTFVVLLIGLRLLFVSIRPGSRSSVPSIDQRTEIGDIRISLDTVENLSLKAAGRTRGVKDLRARVKVSEAGLEIILRAIVDGESSIPQQTEEMQANVKKHIEDITGIPVAFVSVFIANIQQQSSPTFKSRVE